MRQRILQPNSCTLSRMVDIDLIVKELQDNGHIVENLRHVPENAGEYMMMVDGAELNLEEARGVLERDSNR